MEQILNQRRAIRSEPITMARDMSIYDNSWGAGMYGAFYSPRNNRRTSHHSNPNNQRMQAKKIEEALEGSRDYLHEIKDSLTKTLKEITRGLLGLKNREDALRGKGRIGAEDRDDVLKTILGQTQYKTKYQTGREQALLARQELIYKFSKRGIADTLFGVPQEGSARANGRAYEDALKQYQRDRMMLQGSKLIETYGSKRGAEKQIAKDFEMQQKLAKEISTTNKEVERRRKAGWADADINSPEAGKFLDKLNSLMDQYAKYDPTNTGRYLERDVDVTKKPKDRVLPSERFNAGQAIHKDYRGDTTGFKAISPTFKEKNSEEQDLEAAEQHKEDQEVQVKQVTLLEKIAEALEGKKPEKVPGYSDGVPNPFGVLEKLLTPLKYIGTLATSLMTVGKVLLTHLGGLAPILTTLGAVLLPLTAVAALLGLGKDQKEKIEANPHAPEFKDNAYAMKLRGEVESVAQGGAVNAQKALKILQPGTAREYLEAGPDKDGKYLDGYTKEQLEDMAAGRKPKDLAPVPMAVNAQKAVAEKAISDLKNGKDLGNQISKASSANEELKREKAVAPVTVVAPNTTNTNIQGGGKDKSMGPVRNPESSIGDYVKKRYLN